jgi:hypothetical protein
LKLPCSSSSFAVALDHLDSSSVLYTDRVLQAQIQQLVRRMLLLDQLAHDKYLQIFCLQKASKNGYLKDY